MKSILGWLVLVVVLVGAGAGGLVTYRQATREAAYAGALAELKRNFLANTTPLYHLGEEDYRREVGPHLSRYFKGLQELARAYPDLYDVERVRKEVQRKVEAGQMTESQQVQREERITITKDLFERMMQGRYRPLYSRTDKSFRFDIYDISPIKSGAEGRVRLAFVHWGPFGADHKPGQGPVTYRSIIGDIHAVQEKGKPVELPQIIGEAQPPSLQINPERWVAEFPPGVEIGTYDLPLFPPQATAVTLSFQMGIRTIGGTELPVSLAFEQVPIPDAWKVPAGQKWQAQERFATEEELQAAGVTPTQ